MNRPFLSASLTSRTTRLKTRVHVHLRHQLKQAELGGGSLEIVVRLLLTLLGLGLGVNVRIQIVDSLAQTFSLRAGHFPLQRAEVNAEIFADVRCGDALTQILESRTSLLSILARQIAYLGGQLGVLRQQIVDRSSSRLRLRGRSGMGSRRSSERSGRTVAHCRTRTCTSTYTRGRSATSMAVLSKRGSGTQQQTK